MTSFFLKYFRTDRLSFNTLLENLKSHSSYQRSSGFLIHPAIKLGITLRFLAGGSYLDLTFAFEVPHNTIMKYIWEACEAIDASLNNINFPLGDEEGLRYLEQGFMRISGGVFQGTVAAGDGVVFRMQRPHREAVDGDFVSFFTRKGYYAYGMQAFVDSSCKFLSISMKLCPSAHDSTAYCVSDLSNAISDGRLAPWAHIVLDEAYPNGTQELGYLERLF